MDGLDGLDGTVIIGLRAPSVLITNNCQVVFIRKSIHLEVFNQYLYWSFCPQEKRSPEGI